MLIVQTGKSGCVICGHLLFYLGTAWPVERKFAMVALGVFLHALGGFAAGSFYIPFKKVRNWAWESYWLAGVLVHIIVIGQR